jgi:hypothetical protein
MGIEGEILRGLRTRAEVHRNQVVDQVGTQDQAYQEGSLEVGSQAEVPAYQEDQDRNRQEGLTVN